MMVFDWLKNKYEGSNAEGSLKVPGEKEALKLVRYHEKEWGRITKGINLRDLEGTRKMLKEAVHNYNQIQRLKPYGRYFNLSDEGVLEEREPESLIERSREATYKITLSAKDLPTKNIEGVTVSEAKEYYEANIKEIEELKGIIGERKKVGAATESWEGEIYRAKERCALALRIIGELSDNIIPQDILQEYIGILWNPSKKSPEGNPGGGGKTTKTEGELEEEIASRVGAERAKEIEDEVKSRVASIPNSVYHKSSFYELISLLKGGITYSDGREGYLGTSEVYLELSELAIMEGGQEVTLHFIIPENACPLKVRYSNKRGDEERLRTIIEEKILRKQRSSCYCITKKEVNVLGRRGTDLRSEREIAIKSCADVLKIKPEEVIEIIVEDATRVEEFKNDLRRDGLEGYVGKVKPKGVESPEERLKEMQRRSEEIAEHIKPPYHVDKIEYNSIRYKSPYHEGSLFVDHLEDYETIQKILDDFTDAIRITQDILKTCPNIRKFYGFKIKELETNENFLCPYLNLVVDMMPVKDYFGWGTAGIGQRGIKVYWYSPELTKEYLKEGSRMIEATPPATTAHEMEHTLGSGHELIDPLGKIVGLIFYLKHPEYVPPITTSDKEFGWGEFDWLCFEMVDIFGAYLRKDRVGIAREQLNALYKVASAKVDECIKKELSEVDAEEIKERIKGVAKT